MKKITTNLKLGLFKTYYWSNNKQHTSIDEAVNLSEALEIAKKRYGEELIQVVELDTSEEEELK